MMTLRVVFPSLGLRARFRGGRERGERLGVRGGRNTPEPQNPQTLEATLKLTSSFLKLTLSLILTLPPKLQNPRSNS